MANSLMPKSIPTAAPVLIDCGFKTSVQQIDTKYLPLGSCEIVALSIFPSILRDTFALTNPNLGSLIFLSNTWMFPFVYLVLYDLYGFFLLLNFGNP